MSHAIQTRLDGRPGDYFTWAELEVTSTGLPNKPPPDVRVNLMVLVQTVLDPLRKHLGRPVHVMSAYRSPEVNAKIGGSKTSAHMSGNAADIKVVGLDAHQIVEAIRLADLDFDQLVAYSPSRGAHVHIGIRAGQWPRHRHQLLWAPASGGYEAYKAP